MALLPNHDTFTPLFGVKKRLVLHPGVKKGPKALEVVERWRSAQLSSPIWLCR
jgi:hypothetical protein